MPSQRGSRCVNATKSGGRLPKATRWRSRSAGGYLPASPAGGRPRRQTARRAVVAPKSDLLVVKSKRAGVTAKTIALGSKPNAFNVEGGRLGNSWEGQDGWRGENRKRKRQAWKAKFSKTATDATPETLTAEFAIQSDPLNRFFLAGVLSVPCHPSELKTASPSSSC